MAVRLHKDGRARAVRVVRVGCHCLADIYITPSPPQSRQQTPPQHVNHNRWAPHHPTCSASPSSSTSPHPPTRHRLPRGPCPSTSPSVALSMPRITATFHRVLDSGSLDRNYARISLQQDNALPDCSGRRSFTSCVNKIKPCSGEPDSILNSLARDLPATTNIVKVEGQ